MDQQNFDNQDLYQENFNNMNFDSSQVFGDVQIFYQILFLSFIFNDIFK